MAVRKYDASILGYMSVFRDITKVPLRDCFTVDDTIVFVTEPGFAGVAIGKAGKNIQSLKGALKKEFKILEHGGNVQEIVTNFCYPIKPIGVQLSEQNGKKVLFVKFSSGRERRFLLSDDKKRLRQLKAIVKRYYPEIEDVFIPQAE